MVLGELEPEGLLLLFIGNLGASVCSLVPQGTGLETFGLLTERFRLQEQML